jgi:hypothetical protein
MPGKECSPHTVMGALSGTADAAGVESPSGGVFSLNNNGQSVYHDFRNKGASEALKANSKLSGKVDTMIDDGMVAITESAPHSIRGGVTQGLKPSQFMPKEVTDPVLEYIDQFAVQHHGDFKGKQGEFIAGAKRVIKGLDIDSQPEWLQGEIKHWLRDIQEGYPFYGKSGTWLTSGVSNVVGNAVDFSGSIIAGNPFELIIKLPTLYGISGTARGLVEAAKAAPRGNLLWGKIPELEARGYYGYDKPKGRIPLLSSARAFYEKTADTVMAVTDRPLKNLMYGAGYAKGGVQGGLEAIERGAFVNRLGNDSRLTRNPAGRSLLTFSNYTLNTYNMLGSMVLSLGKKETAIDSARGLATYVGLTMALGGSAAILPEGLSWIWGKVDPSFKDWEAEHLTPVGKLVRPGSLTSLGISAQMTSRAAQKAFSHFGKAGEALQDGDVVDATIQLGQGGIYFGSFLPRSPIGNPRVQKTIDATTDLWRGEIDQDEYSEKLINGFAPFLKDSD